MAYAAGVDVGSTQTKAVVVDEAGQIVGRALGPTGANMRAVSALNRIDIPMLWRAVVRAPQKRKGGPVVSILAPRNQSPAGRAGELASAGLSAASIETTDGSIECEFAPGTPATSLVQFAVAALQKLSQGVGVTGEWQWTVRKRGLLMAAGFASGLILAALVLRTSAGSAPASFCSRAAKAADCSSMNALLSRIRACGAMVVTARWATVLSGEAKSNVSSSGTPRVRFTKM